MREFARIEVSGKYPKVTMGGYVCSFEESIERNGRHTLQPDTSRYELGALFCSLLAPYMINEGMKEGDFGTLLFGVFLIFGVAYCFIY